MNNNSERGIVPPNTTSNKPDPQSGLRPPDTSKLNPNPKK